MTATRLRVGIGIVAGILAASLYVFPPGPAGLAVAGAGLALLLVAASRPGPRVLMAGIAVYAAATAGIRMPRYDTLEALLFAAAVGAPLLTLLALVARFDPVPSSRPRLPRRALAARGALLGGLLAAGLLVPALVPAVRGAWTSDLAGVVAVLILGGATLAVLGPLLVDGGRLPVRITAEPVEAARPGVRFAAVAGRRPTGGPGRPPVRFVVRRAP